MAGIERIPTVAAMPSVEDIGPVVAREEIHARLEAARRLGLDRLEKITQATENLGRVSLGMDWSDFGEWIEQFSAESRAIDGMIEQLGQDDLTGRLAWQRQVSANQKAMDAGNGSLYGSQQPQISEAEYTAILAEVPAELPDTSNDTHRVSLFGRMVARAAAHEVSEDWEDRCREAVEVLSGQKDVPVRGRDYVRIGNDKFAILSDLNPKDTYYHKLLSIDGARERIQEKFLRRSDAERTLLAVENALHAERVLDGIRSGGIHPRDRDHPNTQRIIRQYEMVHKNRVTMKDVREEIQWKE